jgi:beta-RFAP synthase
MAESDLAKVVIRATARLHFGFIDLHGGLGRIYGSLGVSLQEPECVVEVHRIKKGLEISGHLRKRVTPIVEQFIEHFGITQGLQITIWESIQEHVGLGSGTQLGLAIGTGISQMTGTMTNSWDLANILQRGAVSGVGTATFAGGGFVVDGGKATKTSNGEDDGIPPLIIRHEIPEDWYFVVAIPSTSKGFSGKRENRAFQELPSAKPESAKMASRLLVMKLLPAIVNDDIETFGEALTRIQTLVGDAFASAQGGRFASPEVTECVNAMLEAEVKGAGQSSWGPTCYGLVRGAKAASQVKKAVTDVVDTSKGGPVFISAVNNQGAKIITD